MDDVVKVIFVIFGLFLGVVFFIAQCQLFAIRRLLEDLVRQGGGSVRTRPPLVSADLPPRG